jgi:hypothetical protein
MVLMVRRSHVLMVLSKPLVNTGSCFLAVVVDDRGASYYLQHIQRPLQPQLLLLQRRIGFAAAVMVLLVATMAVDTVF